MTEPLPPHEHWAEPWVVVGQARHREKAEAAPALRQSCRPSPTGQAVCGRFQVLW